jgi:branched-chain amino acid transport system permease protein
MWMALAGSLAFSIAIGLVIYFVLMRRMIGESYFVAAMVTIGMAILLKAAIIVVWKSRNCCLELGAPVVYSLTSGGTVTLADVYTVAAGVAFFASIHVFFQYTRLGRQFRGTAENPLLASQRQVNVNLILALAWVIAVFAACMSGILYGSRSLLSPSGVIIGLNGLTAALVGGLDSMCGAIVGGLLVAVTSYCTARLISPALSDAVPFIILLIVMSFQPWGLFGTKEELDRV